MIGFWPLDAKNEKTRCAIQDVPSVIPADAGIQVRSKEWTPAFAGVTTIG
jgi:hypothetical protein